MNNRITMAVVGVVAAVAIIFAIVQSGNLSQTETKLSAAQSSATAQQVAFANQGTAAVATLSAASTSAADTANSAATAQANVLTDAQNAAATAQAKALTDAQNAATTAQAKALADAAQAASTLQAQAVAAASQAAATAQAKALTAANNTAATAQASAVTNAQNAASTSQAKAISAAQAQATATLGAIIGAAEDAQKAAATAQASAVTNAQNAAATSQAKAISTAQAQATATLGAVVGAAEDAQNAAATEQANAISTVRAQATSTLGAVVAQAATNAAKTQADFRATQVVAETQIAQANDAVATAQANISANPINPTAVPTDAGATPTVVPTDTAATPTVVPTGAGATPTEVAGAVPKDWKRYVGKGVAIQLPNTYVGSELGSDPDALGKMLRALGPDFEAAATLLEQNPDILAFIAVNVGGNGVAPSSVIVVSIPMPVAFSLNTLLEATVNQLPRGSRVIERSIVQLGEYEAGRMIVQTKVGNITSNQLQYYIIQNNSLYLVGFTGAPGDFDAQLESFEQSMATFEILAKPGI